MVLVDLKHSFDPKVVQSFAFAPVAIHELEVMAVHQNGRGLIVSIVLHQLAFLPLSFFLWEESLHPLRLLLAAQLSQEILGPA